MNIFLIIVLVGCVLFLIAYFFMDKIENSYNVLGNHVPPKYHGYKGGFDNVTICEECQRTALYEDQHPVDPCPNCGGKIKDGFIGKYSFDLAAEVYCWKLKQTNP